ncbi:hypothetical protein IFM89_029372 [Coptis chinensis]|uniref:Kinesin motor domain-containing protein n=2 Tax=Magnoliopsida TaxID=3398 RepID=A0A835M716_9MAGN|nr:hypothetical protein IFM89_029372 [Coptis chinensis]
MGGHMQQSNAAAAAASLYDHPAAAGAGPNNSDAGDAVMARWLQSAGLQHLASPLASTTGIDHRFLPNLLMQGYGAQSAEEKQKLFKLLRNLNLNGESGSEPYTPTAQSSGTVDGFYSPELRGDFGAGLLDLHAMDDTELLLTEVDEEEGCGENERILVNMQVRFVNDDPCWENVRGKILFCKGLALKEKGKGSDQEKNVVFSEDGAWVSMTWRRYSIEVLNLGSREEMAAERVSAEGHGGQDRVRQNIVADGTASVVAETPGEDSSNFNLILSNRESTPVVARELGDMVAERESEGRSVDEEEELVIETESGRREREEQDWFVTEEWGHLHEGKDYLETRDQQRSLSQEIRHGLVIVGPGQSFVFHRVESNLTVMSSLSSGEHYSHDGLNPAAQLTPQVVNTRGLLCPDPITECILDKLDRLLQISASQRKRKSKHYERVYQRKKIYKALQRLEDEQRAIEVQTPAVDEQHVMPESFEPSPFMPPVTRGFDNDFDAETSRQQRGQVADVSNRLQTNEKEITTKESNLAKIKVVVRKRPLNKKELSRKEDDVVSVYESAYLTVHEPKLKVDLTAYVEKHEFCFDAVLDEQVSNDEVYRVTVEPIIPAIFQRTKATCFAYGQTGSGKTFTMQPLPLRACEDIVRLLHHPTYRSQKCKLWLSYFEIYGGKLYDLLSERRKLCMREDGRQQVCIVGLQEFEVSDVQIVKEFIERGNASRSTGSTGANEESSRSHAILQLVIKKHNEVKESRRGVTDANESKSGKVVGKISFIDLAGSERGADTTDNDRQTRIEGAEINKSLLALKECIRALDNDQIHIPFRGSKLTEVLRDSFVGNSKTVMISCISPNAGSCEHTLNTLRYADRVKSLSKTGNSKKDQVPGPLPPILRESASAPSLPVSVGEDGSDPIQEVKVMDMSKRVVEKDNFSYSSTTDYEKQQPSLSHNYPFNGREQPFSLSSNYASNGKEESGVTYGSLHRERVDTRSSIGGSTSNKLYSSTQNSSDTVEAEKVKKVSPPRRKFSKEEKPERQTNLSRKDDSGSAIPTPTYKQQASDSNANSVGTRQYDVESPNDGDINAILEEEEALIAAHRKEIEDTMEIVREEMKLLAEVDQPGSLIDNYVAQLGFVLSRKAASLVSLQARLARFQQRLKEQEILSRKRVPR